MMKTIELKNVAVAKSVVITTYPQWSDYGCLTNALFIARKDDDGTYKEETYVTEEISGGDPAYDVVILNTIDPAEYYQKRFEKQWLNKTGYLAKAGMFVRVVRGRKYAKGTEFLVEGKSDYVVPNTYGKMSIRYLDGRTEGGERIHINSENCIIVGWDKKTSLL